MTDLGVIPKQHHNCEMAATPCSCSEDQKKPHYPRLDLDSENLPEIEQYDVGQTVMLTFQAKVIGKNTDSFWGDGTHVEFKLLQGSCKGTGPDMKQKTGSAPIKKSSDFMHTIMDREDPQETADPAEEDDQAD